MRRSTQISAGFLQEAQVGALLQQIEHEVNLRLAQRQTLIEEMERLESASSQANSLEGLSQLLNHAHAIASADAEEGEIAAALDRVKTAADSRGQFISRLIAEINQVVESALTAQSIEEAEQLLADAQGQAAAHPELEDLQEIMVRASAQVHDRRVEHDLICKELGSLSASISQATGVAELDLIRQKAAQIRDSHSADATVTDLCGQIEVDVQSARAKLLQIELNRLSEDQDALASKSQPEEIASHIRKLQELIKTFPESAEAQAMLLSAQESLERLEARISEQERVLAELTKIAESVRKVPLSKSTELLRRSTQISAGFLQEAQVGALLQQIEHEVNLRLAQRQTLIEEMEQLESASSQANSLKGLSQLLNHAQALASGDEEEGEIAAALDRVKTAAESRRQFISRLMAEINQAVESALTAKSIEEAEQLLADAQGQAAAHPELDDLQKIMVRASAQVHDRRVEHDLICKELGSLSASISQATGVAELDLIRQKAAQIGASHSADATVTDLCGQIEVDVRSARAKLLQIELNRLSEEQDAASSQSQPSAIASHIRKLQELIKTFPESAEARAMLLRAQESLERLERARRQAEARATAIALEINACTRLFESKQPAKALSAIEQAVAKYPESEGLQSLLVKCRERIATEEEAQRQANERRAALQAAIGKGTDLLRTDRFEEAVALLEVACTQWPDEKQLQKLLSTARKSANRQRVEQQKKTQVLGQVSEGPTRNPRKLLLISGVVAALLLLAVLVVPRVINLFARPHLFVLNVESLPSGADVEVDGHKCITPHCSFKLPTGATYTVKADLKGYVSTSQSVTLRNDQTISVELAREQQPAPTIAPPERGQPSALAKLVVKGLRSGDQLFVDDVRVPASGAPGTWDLTPGSHRLRLVEGKQELIADPRQFKPNATVQLDRRDFRQPPPATSAEQNDWARVATGGDIAGLEQFLRTYPNSPLRPQAESKLEDLYWSRANSGGSIRSISRICSQVFVTSGSASFGCTGGDSAPAVGVSPRHQGSLPG